MKPRTIGRAVYLLGAIDWDRRLFESLMPLPDGTSYNCYVVRGSEATALLDSVDPTMTEVLLGQLDQFERIDYVVVHHAEQDHSGSIPAVLERYPDAKVVCSPKCRSMLIEHVRVPAERCVTVEDGETLSLGDRRLRFIHAPWVHWPETMLSYLDDDRVLFTCDFFGSHLATSELYADPAFVYEPAKRYYAEIMMPFQKFIANHLKRLEGLDVRLICPSHGPLYDQPDFILDAYRDWVAGPPKNLALLAYVQMHGSTKLMIDHLTAALVERGVPVAQYNLAETDLGKLAMGLVDAATLIVGSPTVLGGPHPTAAYAAFLANALKPKTRFVSVVGSYGWGGRAPEQLVQMLSNLKAEVLPPVLSRGTPKGDDWAELDRLADTVAERHRALAGVAQIR